MRMPASDHRRNSCGMMRTLMVYWGIDKLVNVDRG